MRRYQLTAALIVAVTLVVVVIVLSRPVTPVASTATSTPLTPATPVASASDSCFPSASALARDGQGPTLVATLTSVATTGAPINGMDWTIEYLAFRNPPAAASVPAHVEITAGGKDRLHVVGYRLVAPRNRTLQDGETFAVGPCERTTLVVTTAGPLIDGTQAYEMTIEDVVIPEGKTVTEHFAVTLSCHPARSTCAQAAAVATPAPTVNPAVLKPTFGVISWGVWGGFDPVNGPTIRREGETAALTHLVGSFFNQFHGAVAPSGRRAVYPGQAMNAPWSLYLLDGSAPTDQRKLLDLPDEIPEEIAWAGDESAVAFVVADSGATQGVLPKYVALRTLDLVSGKVSELARTVDGSYYHIVGWDRAHGTIAFIIVPPSGHLPATYAVLGPLGTTLTTLDNGATHGWDMHGTADGRAVLGIRCEAASGCSIWSWPLADFAARTDQHYPSGHALGFFGWRYGTDELGLSVSDTITYANPHLELWSPTKGSRTIYKWPGTNSAPGYAFFRADGSAVLVTIASSVTVVDIATGATSPLPSPPTPSTTDYARPVASIGLDAP